MPKRYWFVNKIYGYGWTPATWEGWAVIGVWALVFAWCMRRVFAVEATGVEPSFNEMLPLFGSVVGLIVVAAATGEKPEWRWGGKPNMKKPPQR